MVYWRYLLWRHTYYGSTYSTYQATPTVVYWQYFHLCALLGPIGWGLLLVPPRTDAAWFMIATLTLTLTLTVTLTLTLTLALTLTRFMIVCGAVSLYFSNKMIRLVLLLSPAAAVCAGAALGWVVDQTAEAMLTDPEASAAAAARERAARAPSPSALAAARAAAAASHQELLEEVEEDLMEEVHSAWRENVRMRRAGGCGLVLLLTCMLGLRFVPHAWRIGQQLSEPQLLFRGANLTGSGELVQVCSRHSLWLCLLWLCLL